MHCPVCKRHEAYCNCPDIYEGLKPLNESGHIRVSPKNQIKIPPEIEMLFNNIGKRVKVNFESRVYSGIYYLIGKVTDINPETTSFVSEKSDYPGGIFDYLNTSRIRSVELI